MATYFDNFHRTIGRIVPDFGLLKVGPHETDPRAATSIVIASMTLGLFLMLALSLSPPVRLNAPPKSGELIAPPPVAEKVTIVAATPRLDVPNLEVPCAEQTWPYIDRRCLTWSTQKRPQPEAQKREAAPPLDALKATPPVAPVVVSAPPAAVETQGVATRDAAIRPDMGEAPQPPNDYSEAAELNEDAESFPALSPRELRRMERRAAHERRMRHHLHLPIFGRIF